MGPDRRIIDEDVDFAKFRHRFRYHAVNLIFLADVRQDRQRLHAKGLGFARHRIGLGLVATGVDHYMRPFGSQLQNGGSADISTRAGDQRDFAIELPHLYISSYVRNTGFPVVRFGT